MSNYSYLQCIQIINALHIGQYYIDNADSEQKAEKAINTMTDYLRKWVSSDDYVAFDGFCGVDIYDKAMNWLNDFELRFSRKLIAKVNKAMKIDDVALQPGQIWLG